MLNKWRSSLLILAATVLYASLPQAVMAATVTWNGGSGLWSAATQWSSGTVPTAADDVVIPASAGDIITLQGSASANSLTVGAASKLVLDAGFSATSLTVGNGVSND